LNCEACQILDSVRRSCEEGLIFTTEIFMARTTPAAATADIASDHVVFNSSREAILGSQMTSFTAALSRQTGLAFPDYASLHAYSVSDYRAFWRCFIDWLPGFETVGAGEVICEGDECETARFFPNLKINYTDTLLDLTVAAAEEPAITACYADGERGSLTRGELRDRVARLAQALLDQGVREGDCVAAVMRNDAMAVIAALSVAAIGATLATSSPEMGCSALLERFSQLSPRLLIAHMATREFDNGVPVATKVAELASKLPTLMSIINLDDECGPLVSTLACFSANALMARAAATHFKWKRFAFNHPLLILFSSGTTGKPKCIVHGAGGTLLEHLKEHRLHCDLRPGERMYFHTSCAWMMWNWQLSALASGTEVITFDGPVASVDVLWRLVADQRVTVFGTSPAYLKMCEQARLVPSKRFHLSHLRTILSTGAVLFDSQFEWVRDNVKALPLCSISGGSDILGCFVLGNPNLPVVAGKSQCKSLAMGVQAWFGGRETDGVGQLVCTNPFPSRPLGFADDPSGAKFHAAYFAANRGVWTHGDLIEINSAGAARLHGRTDGMLNVRGINVGPAEIYRVLNEIPGVRDALAVQLRPPPQPGPSTNDFVNGASDQRIVLLITMREGDQLTGELRKRICIDLARRASSAHVPDIIIEVPALPFTHNGKLSETAASEAINGLPVTNAAALSNPQCLDAIRDEIDRHCTQAPVPKAEAATSVDDVESYLKTVWQRVFGFAPIEPDDNFFELGGDSLLAVSMLAELAETTGHDLPLSTLSSSPTISALASLIGADTGSSLSPVLVRLRPGEGNPIFIVHGASGTVMGCWTLAQALRTSRPIFGLQAVGLDGQQLPQQRIEEMAATYIEAMRGVQRGGPFALAGYSLGGLVALEIAQQLHRAGERMELVCLLDTYVHERRLPWLAWADFQIGYVRRQYSALRDLPTSGKIHYLRDKATAATDRLRMRLGRSARRTDPAVAGLNVPPVLMRVRESMRLAMSVYRPVRYRGGPIVYVRAQRFQDRGDPLPVWQRVAACGLNIIRVQGDHYEMMSAPYVHEVAMALGSLDPGLFA
jgi:acetoacetyl-CoA synthetase